MQSFRSSLVFILCLVVGWWQPLTEATVLSSHSQRRKQSLRMRASAKHADAVADTASAAKGSQKEEEDDDDDDDDDDDEEPSSTKKETELAQKEDQLEKEINPHAEEEARLKKELKKAEQDLADNLAEQADLKNKIKHLTDESKSRQEIASEVKLVANQTDSAALADMLGKMWKEMRMFEVPFFAQHIEEEIHLRRRDEKHLEARVTEAQAKLNAAEKRWAEEGKAKAASKDTGVQKSSNADAEGVEEPAKKKSPPQEHVLETGQEQVGEHVDTHHQPHEWSFWHMPTKTKWYILSYSCVYFLFGSIMAVIYNKARVQYTNIFTPKRQPGAFGNTKDFTFSLFGCFGDWHMCLLGCCCPIMRWSDTMDRAKLLSFWRAFFILFTLILLHVYTFGISTLVACAVGVVYRQRLRKKYGIESGGAYGMCMDTLAWVCCQPCAIIQEAREEAVDRGA